MTALVVTALVVGSIIATGKKERRKTKEKTFIYYQENKKKNKRKQTKMKRKKKHAWTGERGELAHEANPFPLQTKRSNKLTHGFNVENCVLFCWGVFVYSEGISLKSYYDDG